MMNWFIAFQLQACSTKCQTMESTLNDERSRAQAQLRDNERRLRDLQVCSLFIIVCY